MLLVHRQIQVSKKSVDFLRMDDAALVVRVDVEQNASRPPVLTEFPGVRRRSRPK